MVFRVQFTSAALISEFHSDAHVTAGVPDFVPMVTSTFGVTAPVAIDQFRTGNGRFEYSAAHSARNHQ